MYMNLAFSASLPVREEPAVGGGSIAPGEFVGCVLLEVDDHLMGIHFEALLLGPANFELRIAIYWIS